jgi:hypothetical protein
MGTIDPHSTFDDFGEFFTRVARRSGKTRFEIEQMRIRRGKLTYENNTKTTRRAYTASEKKVEKQLPSWVAKIIGVIYEFAI